MELELLKESPPASPLPSTARRLSRAELRYLVGVLEREIGYCGLASVAGENADVMRQKLLTIHAEGWE